jgi:hypothetical protein
MNQLSTNFGHTHMERGGNDGSTDDDGMGGSSSIAASASGLPNSNHQRHHQRREERGESVLLGKSVRRYIIVLTDVNENCALEGMASGYMITGTNCTPIPYTSTESLIASVWYPKTATATLSLTSTELANPSYNLAYICTWMGSSWKCGCRDASCTQSYWQIQSFKR